MIWKNQSLDLFFRFPAPKPVARRAIILSLLAGLVLTPAVWAHRVTVFAWTDGDTVHTESKLPGGDPVHQGRITVCDQNNQTRLSGATDDQGRFSFGLDQLPEEVHGPLTIVLEAGMGHRSEWTLTAQELGQTDETAGPPEAPPAATVPSRPEVASTEAATASFREPCPSRAEIEAIVTQSVKQQVAPVMKRLSLIQERQAVGLDDIMAGLGYILGLTGLAAYLAARRKSQ